MKRILGPGYKIVNKEYGRTSIKKYKKKIKERVGIDLKLHKQKTLKVVIMGEKIMGDFCSLFSSLPPQSCQLSMLKMYCFCDEKKNLKKNLLQGSASSQDEVTYHICPPT